MFNKGHGVLGQEAEAFSKVNYTVKNAINTESSSSGSSGGQGGGESTPSEPTGVIDTIYLGIDTYGKLTISDVQVVPALEDKSESFNGNKIFGQYETPWHPYADSIYSIEVIGHNRKIASTSTAYWFEELEKVSNIYVTDLDTSNVVDMYSMFANCGDECSAFNITGLDDWNTSNAFDMTYMFSDAGRNATTWTISDISGWDTSNVVYMEGMFWDAGHNTSKINSNFANWATDSLVNAFGMLCGSGKSTTVKTIGTSENLYSSTL